MVDFRKQLPAGLKYDDIGQSVGFFKFGSKAAECINSECARFEAEGLADAPHQEALRNVLLSCPLAFGYEDISGLPWIEIDSPGDVVRAGEEILPLIREEFENF
jgi:choline kinase